MPGQLRGGLGSRSGSHRVQRARLSGCAGTPPCVAPDLAFFQEKPEICASVWNVLIFQNDGQSEAIKSFLG